MIHGVFSLSANSAKATFFRYTHGSFGNSGKLREMCVRWAVTASLAISAAFAADTQSLVQTYCVSCHNSKLATAGVALDKLNPADVKEGSATWERVLQKMRRGEMPPPGLPRPEASLAAKFTGSLEESLDRASAADSNPGRPAVHRLNRAEYSN